MKYIVRAVKYFFYLLILLALVVAVLVLSGLVEGDLGTMFVNGYDSYWQMALVAAALAAIYPRLGYSTHRAHIYGEPADVEDTIQHVMSVRGYVEKDRKNFCPGATATKSVFCFDNRIVYIGSGISNDSSYPTETTLFQYRLDDKNAESGALAALVAGYGVAGQLTFASCNPEKCAEVKALIPEIRIKVWISGCREAILERFRALSEKNFMGFEEVQLHLIDLPERLSGGWRYELTEDDVAAALKRTGSAGVLLQVMPWNFEREDLFRILDLGVRSFAVDYPVRFVRGCAEYFSQQVAGREK